MRLKKFFPLFAFVVIANSVQAIEVTTPSVNIQGGSKSKAIWHTPLNRLYKVWVFVPNNATAVQAVYRLYPKGKAPDSTLCSAIDSYPCIDVAVNQALNKNQWVQLKVNNNADTSWDFIGGKGYVTVSSHNLSRTENLGVAGIRFEEVEPIAYNWTKAIASVSALKLAIGECLNDSSGDYTLCDSLDPLELGKYGISITPPFTALPVLENGVVTIIASTAAVQIKGNALLGSCTFQLQPTVNLTVGLIQWQAKATAAANGNVADCIKYVKNAT